MRRIAGAIVIAALLGGTLSGVALARPAFDRGRPSDGFLRAIRLPLLHWSATHPAAPAEGTAGVALDRERGWTRLGFEVREKANGVYLDVSGRARFDRAEVVFADGDLEQVDLRQTERGGGLYELLAFEGEREVLCVRLLARATSARAKVGLRLGR